MSSNLTPLGSDGGFNTTGNVVAGNVLVVGNIGVSGDASPAPSLNGFDSVNSITVSAFGNITGGNIATSGSGGDITLTGGNITGANVVSANTVSAAGAANVNSINISQSIRWDYSGSQIYEDGGLVINGPGGVLAQGNVAAQFEFNDGVGNSSGLYSTIEESVVYSVEYVTIRANNSGTQTDWTFGTDGNLTIPSGGNITGANTVSANTFTASGNVIGNLFLGNALTIISNVSATANVSTINIIGNDSGNELPAVNLGVMLHATGPQDVPGRVYLDGVGYSTDEGINAFAGFIGRAARGTVDAPTQLLGGDTITRLGGNPYNVDGFNAHTNTRIELVAAEDQTELTRGTQIEFWNTPIGSNVIAKTAVFNSDGITLTGTNLNLVDSNDNSLVAISNAGNITFNGSSTLSLNGGFYVNTVGTNNGNANMVNYVGGAFVYGPALKDYAGNIGAGNISATGNITGNTAGYAIGYLNIPQVSFSGNTTTATTDAGKHYYSTQSTDYILTIANNASQGFQIGAAISVVNQGTGNITVAQGSGVTLYLAGNGTSGNRTVSTFGMATLIKVDTDTWFINGTGVS